MQEHASTFAWGTPPHRQPVKLSYRTDADLAKAIKALGKVSICTKLKPKHLYNIISKKNITYPNNF